VVAPRPTTATTSCVCVSTPALPRADRAGRLPHFRPVHIPSSWLPLPHHPEEPQHEVSYELLGFSPARRALLVSSGTRLRLPPRTRRTSLRSATSARSGPEHRTSRPRHAPERRPQTECARSQHRALARSYHRRDRTRPRLHRPLRTLRTLPHRGRGRARPSDRPPRVPRLVHPRHHH